MKKHFTSVLGPKTLTFVISVTFFSSLSLVNAAETQIFSNEQRQENSNTLILDNDNTGGNVSLQFGSSLNEQVYWDNSGEQFIFTDDVNVQGNVDVDGTITAGSGNIQLTDATGLINGENIANGTIDDDSIDFGTGADQVGADDIAVTDTFDNSSATNVQGVVDDLDQAITNTQSSLGGSTGTTSNSYILDTDNTGGNVTLQFGSTLGKTIYWDSAASRFNISGSVNVEGDIILSGTVDGVDVSGLNTTVGTLGTTVTGIDTDLTTLEGTVATQGTNIGTLNTNLSNLGTTVSGIDTDLTTLEGTVATQGTNIGTLNSDLTALDSTVDTLGTTVGTIDTDLTTLEGTVATQGTNIGTLNTQVGTINTTLAGNKVQSIVVPMNSLTVGADGSNNLADIYTDFDAANKHEYYIVKSQQASQQDVDLKFKVKVPEDFKDFTNATDFSFYYKNSTASAADSKIDIIVEDDEGDDAFAATNLNSASWTNYADEFDGAGFDPAAGEYVYVTVKGYAKSGAKSPYIGEVVINYNSKDVWAQ